MKKYLQNIEKITLANENFRQVLYTGHTSKNLKNLVLQKSF